MKYRPSAFPTLFTPRPSLSGLTAVAFLVALLTGCLQDPGQTGMGYLNDQGVKLSAPLYHFTFENLPVDTVFTTTTDLDHLGDSQLVVGRQSQFTASARLGFTLTSPAQHRHLDTGLGLRLVPMHVRGIIGKEFLIQSAQNRDSLTLLVESFSLTDIGDKFDDSLAFYNTRAIVKRASFASLPASNRRLDTIRISPSGSYGDTLNIDSSQIGALPHLRERLRSVGDSTSKWVIFLNISPLPGSTDSGMFRFSSLLTGNAAKVRTYGSGLWLGRYQEDSLTSVGTLITPYRLSTSGNPPGSNYEIKYTGASTRSLLFGVTRGVHFRLNRDSLLARIKTSLGPDSSLMGPGPTGKFDRTFFVPYAELRIPLRDSLNHVDGPFAFDLGVISDVDSVTDGDVLGKVVVTLGSTLNLTVTGSSGTVSSDQLKVTYNIHPLDSTLRQMSFSWAKTPDKVDTVTLLPDGSNREVAIRPSTGWTRAPVVEMTPLPSQLSIGVFFSAATLNEPKGILDSTGRSVSENSGLQRRFFRPGADSLSVRVTRGVGSLLNRVSTTSIAPDLYLRGVDRPAYDTATVNGKSYNRVPFPVMGEVGIPQDPDGKLRVSLDIYLYPLEGGQ